jgi:serine/threonine protein kinase
MGVVWGAWDPQLDRRVAIKLITGPREWIVSEAQALAKLSHPNVVAAYDVGVVEGDVYLVMEWVHGETLRDYCSKRRSIAETVAVYREAGHGLAAAHRAGIVHRDFKPDNAIRGDDGRVRVLDFGLACGTDIGSSAQYIGTPRYMPPEQVDGAVITPAADQYALCVSLREALVARADLPGWLDDVITRGTAIDPANRFSSMAALVDALERGPASRSLRCRGTARSRGSACRSRRRS